MAALLLLTGFAGALPGDGEVDFLHGLENAHDLMAVGRWRTARERLEALLETHRGERHVLVHLATLEDDLARCAFWMQNEPPDPRRLVSGELLAHGRSGGFVDVRYDPRIPSSLEDFDQPQDGVFMHPLGFRGPYTVELSGRAFPSLGGSTGVVPTLMLDLEGEEGLGIYFGLRHDGVAAIVVQHVRGEEREVLAHAPLSSVRAGSPFDFEARLRSTTLELTYGGRRLLLARRTGSGFGRFGLLGFEPSFGLEEVRVSGSADPGWLHGVVDAEVQSRWRAFTRAHGPSSFLPAWLQAEAALRPASDGGEGTDLESLRRSLAAEQPAAAIERLRELLAVRPTDVDLLGELALVLLRSGAPAEARRVLEEGILAGASPRSLEAIDMLLSKAERGPQWARVFEYRSRHYEVRSDQDRQVCFEVATELENSLVRTGQILGRTRQGSERYRVYVFSSSASYHDYVEDVFGARRENTAGLFSPALGQLLIRSDVPREELLRTTRHEGLHQVLDATLGHVPLWLNEGLAEYHEEGGRRLGAPHKDHLAVLAEDSAWIGLERVLDLGDAVFYGDPDPHYAQAWALVHYFLNGDPRDKRTFDLLLADLRAGRGAAEATRLLKGRLGDLAAFEARWREATEKL